MKRQILTGFLILLFVAGFATADTIHVPGAYPYIELSDAIDKALNGDVIIVAQGEYTGSGFTINADITITGSNPDEPNVVAATIINGAGEEQIGFRLNGAGGTVVLKGLTIINAAPNAGTTIPPIPAPGVRGNANNGWGLTGAGVIINGNHIVSDCVIRNCTVTAGNASIALPGAVGAPDANIPVQPTHPGGHGGIGGTARGAGIAIIAGNPRIENTIIEGCIVNGGNASMGQDGLAAVPGDPNYPGGPGGNGGNGGSTYGGGIYCAGGTPIFENCTIRSCQAFAANGADGGDGGTGADTAVMDPYGFSGWGQGGHGGVPGLAHGAGVYCDNGTNATFIDCNFIGNQAYGAFGGNGGNSNANDQTSYWRGGLGGLATMRFVNAAITAINQRLPVGHPLQPGDFPPQTQSAENYSANGGGVWIENGATATFTGCTFKDNRTTGSISGVGGTHTLLDTVILNDFTSAEQPRNNTRVPSFGSGIYCADTTTTIFTDCTIQGNRTIEAAGPYVGNEYTGYGGGMCFDGGALGANISYVELNDCNIADNNAPVGGGVCASALTVFDVNECNLVGNWAYLGGGLFSIDNFSSIAKSNFIGNRADDPDGDLYGSGGGLFSFSTDVLISDCNISKNTTNGFGAGIYMAGEVEVAIPPLTAEPVLKNCLLSGNEAGADGGGIYCDWYTEPNIINCTITGNEARGDPPFYAGYGGGLYCSYESDVNIVNSIIWGNAGPNTIGPELAVETWFGFGPTTLTVSYCDVEGGEEEVWVDYDSTLNWGAGNIYDDPLFVAGYYLSHTAVGQLVDSNAIDTGSDLASHLGLDTYTTRVDGVPDDPNSYVDMGYHYSQGVAPYKLTITVVGTNGTIDPSPGVYDVNQYATAQLQALPDSNYTVKKWTGTDDDSITGPNNTVTMYSDRTVTVEFMKEFCQLTIEADLGGTVASPWEPNTYTVPSNTVVSLQAVPYEGYRVKRWIGSDDDSSTAKTNTVTIDSDKTVRVEFEQPETITVPGDHTTIQAAIEAAREGDTIQVASGVYYGRARIINKEITITSTNPDDPNVVAATVISGEGYANICVLFTSNVGSNAVLNGLTIANGSYFIIDAEDADDDGEDGPDGGGAEGGGIYCAEGSSPTIKNCIIRDCNITGGNAGDGGGAADGIPAGRGGWGGWAKGAGVYIAPTASPTLINCTITNCRANGADGGNGGDSYGTLGEDYQDAGYGGLWSNPAIPGASWEDWGYVGDYRYYSGYGGGAYCDVNSSPTFIHCTITGNETHGGMSGIGGDRPWTIPDPVTAYEIPTYGGGVYCAENSRVEFIDCNITNNTAPKFTLDGEGEVVYRIDPYLGHGGGIAFEETASVIFRNCNITDNLASVGGGVYFSDPCSPPEFLDCNFVGNFAYRGAGMFGTNGSVIVSNCFVSNNFAGMTPDDVNDVNDMPIAGQGGGIYSASMESQIIDCTIIDNEATTSGGGIFLTGIGANTPTVTNCLVVDNQAGRDGGGLSVNWYAAPLITNCTIVGNEATGDFGEPGKTGLGGGIYSSYHSYSVILNSILWNNYALQGNELAVGTGFEYDPRPSTVSVSYSDIQGSAAGIFVDTDCTLLWDIDPGDPNYPTNIYADPCFVTGPLGDYYLSQTSTNDPNQTVDSPCVDTGNDLARSVGLHLLYTTRTDEVFDTSVVDMGYHYRLARPIELCSFSDLSHNGDVNFVDFAIFSLYWLNEDCSDDNDWCGGADLTFDTYINFDDLFSLCECWLAEDTDAPLPNPSEWEIAPYLTTITPPYTVSMTAEVAFDSWGRVAEYYFECVTGNDSNSGWDPNRTYISTNLDPDTVYGYRVKARDERGNETLWSAVGYAVTSEEQLDTDPPEPDPSEWETEPTATVPTSIMMTATTADDNTPPVWYYFECTNYGDANSSWQEESTYVATDLDPNTQYTFKVRARDSVTPQANETGWSELRSATTFDTDPPQPDPSTWAVEPHSLSSSEIHMMATTASDPSGGVQYQFECVGGPGHSSDWQDDPNYTDTGLAASTQYTYEVRTRDAYNNIGDYSVPRSATTLP